MYTKRSFRWPLWVLLPFLACACSSFAQTSPLDFLWAKRAGGTVNDFSDAVAVDASGNVFVSGFFQSSTIAFDGFTLTNANSLYDIFLAKYDNSGNALWARRAGGDKLDYSYAVAVDASGNAYITGSFSSTKATFGTINLTNVNAGSGDIFLAKYNSAGTVLWAKRAGGTDFDDSDSIAVDAAGNVYITGGFSSATATFGNVTLTNFGPGTEDVFVAKYDSSGNVLWAKRAGGDDFESGLGIAVDAASNVYITGYYYSTNMTFGSLPLPNSAPGFDDIFVTKYDPSGNVLWTRRGGGDGYDRSLGIALDAVANVYVTGNFQSTNATFGTVSFSNAGPGFDDLFVMKYDTSGNFLWAKRAGGTGTDIAENIVVDSAGNAFVAGHFDSASLTFGSVTLTNANPGLDDVFVAKYDPSGNVLWAQRAGGTDFDGSYGLALDATGNVYLTGDFYSPNAFFGLLSLANPTPASSDIFITKMVSPPPQLAVTPPRLDFGVVTVGGTGQASFVVSNAGGAPLTNGVASINGGPFAFQLSTLNYQPSTTFSLPAFGSTNLQVRFAPTNAASFSNAVLFTTGNGGSSTNPLTGVAALVPLAAFTGNPAAGGWPLTVTFTDSSTGTISNRLWDFGDGSQLAITNSQTSVAHTYTVPGAYTVSLKVCGPAGTNALTQPNYITVLNPALLSLSPPNLDFGSVIVGQTNCQSFQVVNAGGMTLTGSVSATLPFATPGGGAFSLAPGQSGLVAVCFAPTNAARFTNAVRFTSNGGNSTNAVAGSGLAPPQLAVSPPRLDFGLLAVGATAQASFVVSNLGGAPLTNGVASVDGGPFAFQLSTFDYQPSTTFNLPAFGSTNLLVRFAPTNAASFSNVVSFTTGNGGSTTNSLTGAATFAPLAAFSGDPVSGGRPLEVSFTDNSTGTITNRLWDFGDGTQLSTTNSQLPFTHTYTAAGAYTVRLAVSGPLGTNILTQPNYITVLDPPQFSFGPDKLNFGPVFIGQSNLLSFQVTNSGGVTLTGTVTVLPPFFLPLSTINPQLTTFAVPGHASTNIVVGFSPAAPGTFSNVVVFTSNGGNATNPVTGSGLVPPHLVVSPPSLDFGRVLLNDSATLSFQVANLGGSILTGSVTGSELFTINESPSLNLQPGQTGSVSVTFAPVDGGSFTNAVVFSSNGGNSTNVVTGYGVTPAQLYVVPYSVDFGAVVVGSHTQAMFVVHNGGEAPLTDGVATLSPGPFAFPLSTLDPQLSTTFSVPGLSSTNVLVSFTPASAGSFTNQVVFDAGNAGHSPHTVTGTGLTPPQLGVSPARLDFGFVRVGAHAEAGLLITNLSGAPFNNGVATLSPGPFAFLLSTTNSQFSTAFSLPGFGSTNVVITFSPTGQGTLTNLVSITSSDAGSSSIPVAGAGALAPVAAFGADRTAGLKPLAVDFADYSTGTITNRSWDFGDGSQFSTTNSQPWVAHTYTTPGTNRVTLVVSGPLGTNVLSRSAYIVVRDGLLITDIARSGANVLVSFTSDAGQFYRVEYANSLSGSPWLPADVVPGTGNIVQAVHLGGAGSRSRFYRVKLLNHSEALPSAGFTAAPALGGNPLTVTFANNSAGWITNSLWDFGDGSQLSTTNSQLPVTHTYTTPGTNSVTLTVSSPLGNSVLTRTNYIVVRDRFPAPSISVSGSNVVIGFRSEAGAFYRIEFSYSLSSPLWLTAVPFVPGTGGQVQTTVPGGAVGSSRFYRVRLLDASELLRLTAVSVSGSDVLLNFISEAGKFYRVEYTDRLSGSSWTTAVPFVEGVGGIAQATHVGGAGLGLRFYRVRLLNDSDLFIPITIIRSSPTQVLLRFNTVADLKYRMEYTQALTGGGWTIGQDNIRGTGGLVEVSDTNLTGSSRYYRVRLVP